MDDKKITGLRFRSYRDTEENFNDSATYNSKEVKAQATTSYIPTTPSLEISPIMLQTINSPNIILTDVTPLDDQKKQNYDFRILLFFINYSEPKKQFLTKIFSVFNRSVNKVQSSYSESLKKLDRLNILAEEGLIKKNIVKDILTDGMYYTAISHSSLLLRDSANILNYMPDRYKAYLLKTFPENEKTEYNLKDAFKIEIKKSYKIFMTLLYRSQQSYNLLTKDVTVKLQVKKQLENLKSLNLNIDIKNMEDILENTTDEKEIIKKYDKFRKTIKKIIGKKHCLAKTSELKQHYNMNYALRWGMLELGIMETQEKVIAIINDANKIYNSVDKSIDESIDKYIDKFKEICEILEKQEAEINSIIKEVKGKVPEQLYKEITEGSIISKQEFDKMITSLKTVNNKTITKVKECLEKCKNIQDSQKDSN